VRARFRVRPTGAHEMYAKSEIRKTMDINNRKLLLLLLQLKCNFEGLKLRILQYYGLQNAFRIIYKCFITRHVVTVNLTGRIRFKMSFSIVSNSFKSKNGSFLMILDGR